MTLIVIKMGSFEDRVGEDGKEQENIKSTTTMNEKIQESIIQNKRHKTPS